MDNTLPNYTRRWMLRASALIGVAASSGSAWAADADIASDLNVRGMPYAAFDRMPAIPLDIGGGRIQVAFGPGAFDISRDRIMDYIRQSARSVVVYFGKFPARNTRLLILNTTEPGRPIRSGTTFGYRGAAIKLTLAANVSAADMDNDWILVHEMSHIAMPSLPRQHHWFEEGMASYVEPLARAQAGVLSVERVWGDMVDGMPKGLPQAGDRGLDHTPTWGRTYWGGALFCLLADVEIREATSGKKGLQHALRAILQRGNIEEDSPIEPLLQTGDQATGAPILASLYARMKDSPYPVDLDQLWTRLGIHVSAGGVEFDDTAPLSAIRKALTRPIASS